METFLAWDKAVFYWINHDWANPVLDAILSALTDFDNWRIPVVIAFLLLAVLGRTKGRVTVLMLAVGIVMSDQAAAGLIKPLVSRVRPCEALENVRLLIPRSGAPSFPSAHAANMACSALLLSVRYARLKWVWIGLALLVSVSRVYVGVHYPLDVLGGIGVGLAVGGLVLLAGRWMAPRVRALVDSARRRG